MQTDNVMESHLRRAYNGCALHLVAPYENLRAALELCYVAGYNAHLHPAINPLFYGPSEGELT